MLAGRGERERGGDDQDPGAAHGEPAQAARAYEAAFGRAPVYAREGGTIPVVALLERRLGLPSVLMGFGLPDDNLHAPNERFRVENFYRGIDASVVFLEALADEADRA